jgi:hypothetical protein
MAQSHIKSRKLYRLATLSRRIAQKATQINLVGLIDKMQAKLRQFQKLLSIPDIGTSGSFIKPEPYSSLSITLANMNEQLKAWGKLPPFRDAGLKIQLDKITKMIDRAVLTHKREIDAFNGMRGKSPMGELQSQIEIAYGELEAAARGAIRQLENIKSATSPATS